MNEFSNGLSPAQAERLALLIEECAEVQQVATKILRHGYESHHPDNPSENNRTLLENELGDLQFARILLRERGDVDSNRIAQAAVVARRKKFRYLHHQ